MKGVIYHYNVENGVTHGADVLMELVLTWVNNHRIFCADNYFSLVAAAKLIYLNGLNFIGVVKSLTRKYLMAH